VTPSIIIPTHVTERSIAWLFVRHVQNGYYYGLQYSPMSDSFSLVHTNGAKLDLGTTAVSDTVQSHIITDNYEAWETSILLLIATDGILLLNK